MSRLLIQLRLKAKNWSVSVSTLSRVKCKWLFLTWILVAKPSTDLVNSWSQYSSSISLRFVLGFFYAHFLVELCYCCQFALLKCSRYCGHWQLTTLMKWTRQNWNISTNCHIQIYKIDLLYQFQAHCLIKNDGFVSFFFRLISSVCTRVQKKCFVHEWT